jgi:hypothetical protein
VPDVKDVGLVVVYAPVNKGVDTKNSYFNGIVSRDFGVLFLFN